MKRLSNDTKKTLGLIRDIGCWGVRQVLREKVADPIEHWIYLEMAEMAIRRWWHSYARQHEVYVLLVNSLAVKRKWLLLKGMERAVRSEKKAAVEKERCRHLTLLSKTDTGLIGLPAYWAYDARSAVHCVRVALYKDPHHNGYLLSKFFQKKNGMFPAYVRDRDRENILRRRIIELLSLEAAFGLDAAIHHLYHGTVPPLLVGTPLWEVVV